MRRSGRRGYRTSRVNERYRSGKVRRGHDGISDALHPRPTHRASEPENTGRQLDVDNRKYDMGEFVYEKVISANDPATVVRTVEPDFPGYLRTLDVLHRYREFAKVDTGKPMQVPDKSIAPGETYADLPRLSQLLQLVGDLPANAQIDPNSTAYQGALIEAVKSYQIRHGELPDGHLKDELIKEMNVPMTHQHPRVFCFAASQNRNAYEIKNSLPSAGHVREAQAQRGFPDDEATL